MSVGPSGAPEPLRCKERPLTPQTSPKLQGFCTAFSCTSPAEHSPPCIEATRTDDDRPFFVQMTQTTCRLFLQQWLQRCTRMTSPFAATVIMTGPRFVNVSSKLLPLWEVQRAFAQMDRNKDW